MKSAQKEEFGDFQTPQSLAREVCELVNKWWGQPDVVLEPTCGVGGFLVAAGHTFPRSRLVGMEINISHLDAAHTALRFAGERVSLAQQDFFDCDWDSVLGCHAGRLLILGNPPWVTNSAVAALNGTNLPEKQNFLGLKGMAAKTGKSNFDISEWMLIRLLQALGRRSSGVAMLCKTATARKVLRYGWQHARTISRAAIYHIDAHRHFGASVDACLLMIETGVPGPLEADCYESLADEHPARRLGIAGQDLVADVVEYRKWRHLEGVSHVQWRSGIKHDCSAVMEFRLGDDETLINGDGQVVRMEAECIYPLLKCTDLHHQRITPTRRVLVTQKSVGEDTRMIRETAPLSWAYLQLHRSRFESRKSSIYRGKPPFSMFGVGDYSFAPWKVAVSGLHKASRFVVVPPFEGKPVMLDDTCYFLPFNAEGDARLVCEVLNSRPCQQFINALVFPDAKRTITVDVLQRISLRAAAESADLGEKWNSSHHAQYEPAGVPAQLEMIMEEPGGYAAGVQEK